MSIAAGGYKRKKNKVQHAKFICHMLRQRGGSNNSLRQVDLQGSGARHLGFAHNCSHPPEP